MSKREENIRVQKIDVESGHKLKEGHDHAQTVNTQHGPQERTQWPGQGGGNKPK